MNFRGEDNDIAIGVYNRLPNQAEEMDKLFAKELIEACRKHTGVVMGDFSYSDINWETTSSGSGRLNKFQMCLADNVVSQKIHEDTKGSAILDLIIY